MKLPADPAERYNLYTELCARMQDTASERKKFYTRMRSYYDRGTDSASCEFAWFNNIYPHLDSLMAFLFSADTTKFEAKADGYLLPSDLAKLNAVTRRVAREWHESNAAQVFMSALLESLICASAFVKVVVHDRGLMPFMVRPEDIGVAREDVAFLSRQDGIVQSYRISLDSLKRMIENHPRKDEIINKIASAAAKRTEEEGTFRNILISRASPTIEGNVILPWSHLDAPGAQLAVDTVLMNELYVYDDEKRDYRVVTMADPGIVVFERYASEILVKNELPMIQVCPNPRQTYFFGESEVLRLVPLQDMLQERLSDIKDILHKQADPARVGYGLSGPQDEMAGALSSAGSFTPFAEESGKITELRPPVGSELFKDMQDIISMFDQVSGLNSIAQGRQAGGRSELQQQSIVRLATARAKKRALIVEDSINAIATLYYQLLRKYAKDEILIDDEGNKFTMAQAPEDLRIIVDSHSCSPAFVEDTKELAFALQRAGVIDGTSLIEMIDPPMKDLLIRKLQTAEKAKALQDAKEGATTGGTGKPADAKKG